MRERWQYAYLYSSFLNILCASGKSNISITSSPSFPLSISHTFLSLSKSQRNNIIPYLCFEGKKIRQCVSARNRLYSIYMERERVFTVVLEPPFLNVSANNTENTQGSFTVSQFAMSKAVFHLKCPAKCLHCDFLCEDFFCCWEN